RRTRALGSLGELLAKRQHPLHRRPRPKDGSRDAQNEELWPQVAEGDQRDLGSDGTCAGDEDPQLAGPTAGPRGRLTCDIESRAANSAAIRLTVTRCGATW